jgi:hypothetical protein
MTEAAIPAHLDARRAMPADDFLAQIGLMNLDGHMDGREQAGGSYARHLETERAQIAALAARFYQSEFRPLLEWMLDASLRRPVFMPGLNAEGVAYCAHREGQNSIVWQLVQAIAEGRKETPPAREGT